MRIYWHARSEEACHNIVGHGVHNLTAIVRGDTQAQADQLARVVCDALNAHERKQVRDVAELASGLVRD